MSFCEGKGDSVSSVASFYHEHLMSTLEEGTYFPLNQQAISSLDILPKLKADGLPDTSRNTNASSRSDQTVYAVLNKCRTTSGQRLLAIWLQHPLKSKDRIDKRLDIIEHFVENNELRNICYDDYLRKIPDLLRICFKISKEKCNLLDLMKIYNACKSVEVLCRSFARINEISDITPPEAVNRLFDCARESCEALSEFKGLIDESIDVDSIDEAGEYLVRPGQDTELARLSNEVNTYAMQARRLLGSVAEELNLEKDKSVKLETDPDKGFALRVTKQNEQFVRGNRSFEQLSLVKKDGYRFTNRALTKLSNKYVEAKQDYEQLAKRIIDDVICKAVMYHGEVLDFSLAMTCIDVFVGLAVVASSNNYSRPLILDAEAEKIDLVKLRHPCIENQPDVENYVPNDITLSQDGKKFYIITGPNMGGKSTFIKSVAVAVIMAHCGSLIPVEEARVSICDNVFTRVGAGDKQMEGISTFMEEMMDMSQILKEATRNSLVIIDELGRGTSTFDGFGLAWSISKDLAARINSFTLFATHFHEITEMEEEISTVGNLHVKAFCKDDKLVMLYNIAEGVCDESYGINVAQFTQFPERVVACAKEKLKQFEEVPGFTSKKEVRDFIKECVKEHLARQVKA